MKKLLIIFLFVLNFSNLTAKTSYFNEGLMFYEQKKFDKAKFKFEQDIVFNPKNERSYLYLSKIFKEQKKIKLEEKNLTTVILLDPKNEEAIYNLAILKLKESDYNESKKLIINLSTFCKEYCDKSKKIEIEIENSLKK